MNARHAAREMALLTLFQLDRQGNGVLDAASLKRENIQTMVLASVRALSAEAEDKIQTAADELASVSRMLIEFETEHPSNLNSPIDAASQPVAIPTTREMIERIERCLEGAEYLFEALRFPELVALMRQDTVQEYAQRLMSLVAEHRAELDEKLNACMQEWRVDRLVKIDAYILRLAAAEMLHINNVDLSVSINEAVDLAKQFSTEESYRLINGVLGALAEAAAQATGKTLLGVKRELPIT